MSASLKVYDLLKDFLLWVGPVIIQYPHPVFPNTGSHWQPSSPSDDHCQTVIIEHLHNFHVLGMLSELIPYDFIKCLIKSEARALVIWYACKTNQSWSYFSFSLLYLLFNTTFEIKRGAIIFGTIWFYFQTYSRIKCEAIWWTATVWLTNCLVFFTLETWNVKFCRYLQAKNWITESRRTLLFT